MSLTVRPATAADLEAIVTIENGAFPDPWSRRSFASMLDAPTVRFDVLEDPAGAVLGYVVLLVAPPDADVANLAVAPKARRQGAGRALLGAALASAARAGVRRVHLEVRESNAAARALYAAFGFVPVGRRRAYYQQPREDALVLRATLSDPGE